MELNDAQELIKRLVKTGETHQDYAEVKEYAEKLSILITGKGTAKLLRQANTKEDIKSFIQRCAITKSITPAVAASVQIPYYKVARNQRVKQTIDVKDSYKQKLIYEMIKGFYGSTGRRTKGLDYWLRTRFIDLSFTDPNAWVVVEWDAPKNAAQVLAPRPFEISAAQAVNFKVINETTLWMLAKLPSTYRVLKNGEVVVEPSVKWTLYDQDFTIIYDLVDPDYLASINFVPAPNQRLITDATDKIVYLETVNTPKIGFTPAFRIGYKRNLATNGRTFVNPFHDGMAFFDKSIKVVSEFDLTMTNHVFPQKIQYAPRCPGDGNKKCNGGVVAGTSNTCQVCNGTGFAGHKGAQDILTLPMPEKGTPNAEIIDLTKLIAYITPSMELIKFQNEYIQQLKTETHQAVFNSTVLIRKGTAGQPAGGGTQPTQTATENDNDMQSVYDALEPFTEKFSDVWKEIVTIIASLVNVDVDNVEIDHIFPSDFKLKSQDVLLSELEKVNGSGAPSFMRDLISNDLAEVVFAGDTLGIVKFKTKRKFFPFNGKNEEEIAMLLSSPNVPRKAKVLYSNFELIFTNIEYDRPDFYTMKDTAKQRQILDDAVVAMIAEIDQDAPVLTLGTFRPTVPAGGNQNPGGTGNPGEEQETQEQNTPAA
jgi:hypothetical protein